MPLLRVFFGKFSKSLFGPFVAHGPRLGHAWSRTYLLSTFPPCPKIYVYSHRPAVPNHWDAYRQRDFLVGPIFFLSWHPLSGMHLSFIIFLTTTHVHIYYTIFAWLHISVIFHWIRFLFISIHLSCSKDFYSKDYSSNCRYGFLQCLPKLVRYGSLLSRWCLPKSLDSEKKIEIR